MKRLALIFFVALAIAAGGCERPEPPSTFESSNTKGGPEATEIDRTKPLCSLSS